MLPSILKSRITTTIAVIVAVLGLVALSGCSKKVATAEAQNTWNAYVAAMKAGDATAARACFASESQPFCVLTKKEMDWFSRCQFKLLNSEQGDKYTKLEFEQTVYGKPWPRSIYFVRQGNRTVMQYPYILFTSDWPVVNTAHFRFHLDPSLVSDKSKQNRYVDLIDTLPYEQFIGTIDSLTGLAVTEPIDYYYTQDTTTGAALLGSQFSRGCLGRTIVTTKKNDFRFVSNLPMIYDSNRIEFLQSCLRQYGDMERVKLDPHLEAMRGLQVTMAQQLGTVTPESFDVDMISEAVDSKPAKSGGWVSMASMTDLLKRHDARTFRELYDRSTSVDSFKQALADLYHLTPDTWLTALKKEFPMPEQALNN